MRNNIFIGIRMGKNIDMQIVSHQMQGWNFTFESCSDKRCA